MNKEIIKIVETKKRASFEKTILLESIKYWNFDMIDYALKNYGYDYFLKSGIKINDDMKKCLDKAFFLTFATSNFIFYKSILNPFFQNNPVYAKENIFF